MKKAFLVFLVLAMLLSISTTAFAAVVPGNVTVSPRYAYIDNTYTSLSIDQNTGISTSHAQCAALDYTVGVECTLKRYVGAIWTPLKTWTASGADEAVIVEDWKVYKGSNYRIDVTFRIYNASGALLETVTTTEYCAY